MKRISIFAAFALLLILSLMGCGGGGGGGGNVDYTVNTQFPAYDAQSTNPLARARSVWVVVYPANNNTGRWADMLPRPSEAGGTITRRISADNPMVDIQVRAYASTDGTGQQIASKTFEDVPRGSTITVSDLN
jgi:hypothetical protein